MSVQQMTTFLSLFLVYFYSYPKTWAFSPPKSSYCHAIQSACCKETKTTAKRMKIFSEEQHGDQQVEELDTPKQGFEQIPSNPPIPFTNNNILSRRSSIASAANFLAATAILSPTISSATSIGDDDSNTLQNSIDDPTTNFSIPSITITIPTKSLCIHHILHHWKKSIWSDHRYWFTVSTCTGRVRNIL